MDYDIDLPKELKTASMPKFKTTGKELIIVNKPSLWDIMFPSVCIIIFFVMTLNKKISFENSDIGSYLILAIDLMLLLLIQYLSLNKVSIDFELKCISIKNYNPLVNVGRKILQMPALIMFTDIEKFYSDYQFWGKSTYKHKIILQTTALYKFRIAIFSKRQESILFAEYLKNVIH
ncbi:hypothetical protein [Parafilimonas sp.]|uniref:hypothetical protein n=1 Tax=Parafilimonas sp. TaxID=1969739 RepID=UPI0039E3E056